MPAAGREEGGIVEWNWLTRRVGFLPATAQPLSADVGLVRTDEMLWIYDVGCTPAVEQALNALPGKKSVVLSHFHPDHTGNLGRVTYHALYAGAFTCKKTGTGTAVTGELVLPGGMRLFPVPAIHAKGCLGMECGEYAFLGDALYPAVKNGQAVYNVSLLAEQIRLLEQRKAEWFLLSHQRPFVQAKEQTLARLRKLYARRVPGQTYLPAEEAEATN